MIKSLHIVFLFMSMSFSSLGNAACTCIKDEKISIKKLTTSEFYNASTIFLGEVIKVEDMDNTPIGKLRPFNVPIKYTFKVTEMIKGREVDVIKVYSDHSTASCGFIFELGTKYLVFGKQSIKYQKHTPKTWSTITSECVGNTLRRHTEKKRLDILRKLAKS